MWNKITDRITRCAARRWSLACGGALALALLGAAGCDAAMDDPATAADGSDSLEADGGQGMQLFVQNAAADTSAVVTPDASYPLSFSVHATRAPVIAIHPTGIGTIEMFGGTTFQKGDYAQWNKARLVMQSDGNFVLYDENGHSPWASNTFGTGARATFQTDANLVVYNSANQAIRTNHVPTDTCCHSGWTFHVQSDGNLVIYQPTWIPKWSTRTNH